MEQISMMRKSQASMESTQPLPSNDGGVYEIKIEERLDDHWKEWFEGMDLKHVENSELGRQCTLIIGPIADQSALHGLLAKIRDLNLTLISVRKMALTDSNRQE
ncbi:MAG TPA: hypothetical protein VK249_15830 [Anaerolineales bacterium]|nr:hypothetical protein [Anaerolineales bacterium]